MQPTQFDKMPGEFVNVNGTQLHIRVQGQGEPTIVFDSGMGGTGATDWALVQPELSRTNRTVSYDRAGYGWSEAAQTSRTTQQIVEDLHSLLEKAEIKPSFVLVGHSLGGLNMLEFARRYPQEVAGLVLVEATHGAVDKLPKNLRKMLALQAKLQGAMGFLAKIGLTKLILKLVSPKNMPPEIVAGFKRNYSNPAFYTAINGEINSLLQQPVAAYTPGMLGDLPLVVISRKMPEPKNGKAPNQIEVIWRQLHAEMAQLSGQSRHIIAEKPTHFTITEEPQLVIEAIKSVVEIARNRLLQAH